MRKAAKPSPLGDERVCANLKQPGPQGSPCTRTTKATRQGQTNQQIKKNRHRKTRRKRHEYQASTEKENTRAAPSAKKSRNTKAKRQPPFRVIGVASDGKPPPRIESPRRIFSQIDRNRHTNKIPPKKKKAETNVEKAARTKPNGPSRAKNKEKEGQPR